MCWTFRWKRPALSEGNDKGVSRADEREGLRVCEPCAKDPAVSECVGYCEYRDCPQKAVVVRYREALEQIEAFAVAKGGEFKEGYPNENHVLKIARAALGDEPDA